MKVQEPFADVVVLPDGLSLPDLKWRELLFIGALRADGGAFVRDPARPMPPFVLPDPFPDGVHFRVAARDGKRVTLQRVPAGPV
ncbi:MAG TPA: hypothetical protein VFQ51_10245 [Vicinamibacteria bacterium]|nr:hypothetical protein [Vicinamibacteria bacterium]